MDGLAKWEKQFWVKSSTVKVTRSRNDHRVCAQAPERTDHGVWLGVVQWPVVADWLV